MVEKILCLIALSLAAAIIAVMLAVDLKRYGDRSKQTVTSKLYEDLETRQQHRQRYDKLLAESRAEINRITGELNRTPVPTAPRNRPPAASALVQKALAEGGAHVRLVQAIDTRLTEVAAQGGSYTGLAQHWHDSLFTDAENQQLGALRSVLKLAPDERTWQRLQMILWSEKLLTAMLPRVPDRTRARNTVRRHTDERTKLLLGRGTRYTAYANWMKKTSLRTEWGK